MEDSDNRQLSSTSADSSSGTAADTTSPRARAAGLLVLLALLALIVPAQIFARGATFDGRHNAQIAEATAWWGGSLDLPQRLHDTALYDGKVYSHFPIMFSLLAATVVPLFGGVPHWFVVIVVVLPVPLLAYRLMVRRTASLPGAVMLAFALVAGTSMLPVFDHALRGCRPYFVNQCLSATGMLLFLSEWFGARRLAIMAVALVITSWSRQLTFALWIPLAWSAWFDGDHRTRRLACAGLTAVVILGVPAILNTLKFGNPLETGYLLIYEDRAEDSFSTDAREHGIFSIDYVPRNLYWTNIGPPRLHRIEIEGREERYLRPNLYGSGIWWTTPLLLWLPVAWRRIWSNRANRVLLAAAALVFAALMCYHSTGYAQRGFNRYSLDYLPVLLALAAPWMLGGWRSWLSGGMMAWSVVYFRWLI